MIIKKDEVVNVDEVATEDEINIYAGTGENADLSNFAIRPFEYKDRIYQSVEQAFQLQKYLEFSNENKNIEIGNKMWKTTNGAELRKLGKLIQDLNTVSWDRMSSLILKDLIKNSFEQNSKALEELLNTGNAELTHIQDKTKWGVEFPKLLMEVREELGGKKFISNKPQQLSLFDNIQESKVMNSLKEMFQQGLMLDKFSESGINSIEDLDNKSEDELGELLKKICK